MAKICPLTGDTVLYQDCIDCDDRSKCRTGTEYTGVRITPEDNENKKEQPEI